MSCSLCVLDRAPLRGRTVSTTHVTAGGRVLVAELAAVGCVGALDAAVAAAWVVGDRRDVA